MKISKRQLKRIIREEKQKLLKEQGSPGDAIAAAERALIAIALDEIRGGNQNITDQVYAHMFDGDGYDDPEIQMALDQLMDQYNKF